MSENRHTVITDVTRDTLSLSCDKKNTRLVVITEFNKKEESLSLQAVRATTEGEDLLQQVCVGYEEMAL